MRDTVSTPTSLLPPTLFPSPHSPPCIHLLSSSLFQLHTHLLSLAWISRLQPAAAQPSTPRAQRHKGFTHPHCHCRHQTGQ